MAIIGYDAKVGYKLEAVYGTPIAVGAGDQILVSGMAPTDGKTFTPNDDELVPGITRLAETRGQPTVPIANLTPYYLGIDDIIAGFFGTMISSTAQNSGLSSAKAREYGMLSVPTASGTLVYCPLETPIDADTIEIPACMVQSLDINGADGAECVMPVNMLSYPRVRAGTNGATEVNALTFPRTNGQCGVMHFSHMALQLARQDGTLAYQQVMGFALSIGRSLTEDNQVTQNSAGATMAQPVPGGKRVILLTLNLHSIADFEWLTARDQAASYPWKAIMTFFDTRGCPGVSVSASSPGTDITGIGVTADFGISIDGVASANVTLTTAGLNSGTLIAAAIQVAVRALASSVNARYYKAYSEFTCDYNTTVAGKYHCKAGDHRGALSSAVIIAGALADCAATLKLGVANGGTEHVGIYNMARGYLPELWLTGSNPEAFQGPGVVRPQLAFRAGIGYGSSTPTGFTSADTYLTTDMSSEDIRWVTINELAADPI